MVIQLTPILAAQVADELDPLSPSGIEVALSIGAVVVVIAIALLVVWLLRRDRR